MEELVQYTSNSFVKGMCYKKLSNYINPNKITSWTSDVKTISGTELVNAIKERDTVSQDSVYLCYDPNDLYKMTSLGEINNDFFIRLDELVELILAKEQVHMTLQKITIALKTSYEVLDSYLLKFPTPAQWLADPNPITVIKTMHMNDKKVFHPLQSVPYSDKNMTSIVYSLSNTIIKDNELEYAYYFKYPFKSQLVPYLNSFKIIKGDKYGVLPMCDNLIMGSSHTYKSSVLNSIIFRLLFSRELYTCTTHEEQDKLSISVEPLNPNKIMVIRLIVSEAREPVTVGSIDLSSELNKLSNYRTWVLPYSKIGYFLILLHQCYLLEDYYDHFVIVWDSMSDQLLGQWALQELQRTSQLKSEGLNTAARLDLSMIYALTEKFNNRGTGKKKRTSLSVIGSANTDTDKSTAVTFPQVNGIMMTAISMYGGSTYVPEGYDAIARLRMRRNSLFEDGIWQLESILRYQSKFEKEKKW